MQLNANQIGAEHLFICSNKNTTAFFEVRMEHPDLTGAPILLF